MFNVVPGEVTSMFTVTEKVKCPVSRAKALHPIHGHGHAFITLVQACNVAVQNSMSS